VSIKETRIGYKPRAVAIFWDIKASAWINLCSRSEHKKCTWWSIYVCCSRSKNDDCYLSQNAPTS